MERIKQFLMRLKKAERIAMILFGNACVALAVVFFLKPAGFIGGGTTGVALALEAFFGIPISVGIFILCIALLGIGWIFLGRDFAARSAVSTVSYPIFVWIFEELHKVVPFGTEDIALNLVCTILLFGFGIAAILRQGASSGGLDTISMILYEKRGIPLALTVNLFEILSMLTQISYSTPEEIMGGVLAAIFYTALMNRLMTKGIARIQVFIYSRHYEEICRFIGKDMDRGCTLFSVQGGYERRHTYAVQTIICHRELFTLKEALHRIDPLAFVTISEVSEVSGRGFGIDPTTPHEPYDDEGK